MNSKNLVRSVLFALMSCVAIVSAHADDTQDQIDKLKKETELINAQKAKLDAEKALAEAQKVADTSQANALADLQNEKAILDAQKALADAQTAAWLAKNVGTVPAGPYTGATTIDAKTGALEAALLASKAVRACAADLAGRVKDKFPCERPPNASKADPCIPEVYLYRASTFPTFQAQSALEFRSEFTRQVLQNAIDKAEPVVAPHRTPGVEFLAVPAAVGGIMSAVSNLLGFAKTDFNVTGVDAQLDENVLLYTVAGAIEPGPMIHVPSIYNPLGTADVKELTDKLIALETLRGRAAKLLAEVNAIVAKKDAAAAAATKAKNTNLAAEYTKVADSLRPEAAPLTAAISTYDAFLSYFTTAAADGSIPLTKAAEETTIRAALQKGASVLLVRLEKTGGGALVKKNLLTGLGAMPLYHMGGAAISFMLLDGKTGKVIDGDAIPIFGGYARSDKLQAVLER